MATDQPQWTQSSDPPEAPHADNPFSDSPEAEDTASGNNSPFTGGNSVVKETDSRFSDTPDTDSGDWSPTRKSSISMEESIEGKDAELKSLWWKATTKSVTVFQITDIQMKSGGQYPPKNRKQWAEFTCETDDGVTFLLELKSTTVYKLFRDVRAELELTNPEGVWFRLEVVTPSREGSIEIPELNLQAVTPDGRRAEAVSRRRAK